MSSILGKIPKFTLKLPSALAKAGRTMSECPLELSFSLCDDGSCVKNKTEEQIPLQGRKRESVASVDKSKGGKEILKYQENITSRRGTSLRSVDDPSSLRAKRRVGSWRWSTAFIEIPSEFNDFLSTFADVSSDQWRCVHTHIAMGPCILVGPKSE
ncbi:uncharacterized protein TNCV_3946821 [Trichonephila clavipes]|nr:uncharacterized protein TNCV_3946821 [Trichonephila clavipes]